MPTPLPEPLLQVGLALCYYFGLIAIMRVAGKRLAGQTTTFDLLVLIALGVVLQNTVLRDGTLNSFVFIATVLVAHVGLARLCARSRRVRRLVRGAPRPLIWNGQVAYEALEEEGLSYDELLAGLRKLGYAHPKAVRLATLEETGHISAVANDDAANDAAATGEARAAGEVPREAPRTVGRVRDRGDV
jgi:uncharacterized membrane protein YcaP (DUF421 family)